MKEEKISRYPGLVPFKENQFHLFFGRKKEKAELYNFLVAEQTIVMFAKSGAGKSSLLQAGLFPMLRENGYHPVKVRFQYAVEYDTNHSDETKIRRTPLQILFDTLDQRSKADDDVISINKDEILFNKEQPRLWEYLKVIQLPVVVVAQQPVIQEEAVQQVSQAAVLNEGEEKPQSYLFRSRTNAKREIRQTPVLVFDQFEEFFNFPEHERHAFMQQLCEVLHNLCPNRIGEWLRGYKLSERTPAMVEWAKQPVVKCIIAIRDDRLSELDFLRKYVPLILKNRYKLSPLSITNAKEAMEEPAGLEGNFISPVFTFDEATLQSILERLAGNEPEEQMFETGVARAVDNQAVNWGIDGSQLQKVCSYIEKKVIERGRSGKPIVVDKTFINPDVEVQQILDRFYEDQLNSIGNEKDIALCRALIEERLVSGGARASLTQNQMDEHLKEKKYLIEKMTDARLIKEEYTHLGRTYELSHDTLVKSVARAAREKRVSVLTKENRKQKRYIMLFLVLSILCFLSLIAAIVLGRKVNNSLNANNLQLAEAAYQQNNQYIAFNIWDDFTKRNLVSSTQKTIVRKQLDSLTFFDIPGGRKIVRLNDWKMAVHERDNTIHLWTIPGNGKRLEVTTIPDAYNLEVSDSKRYLGYRSKQGALMIYDVDSAKSFRIEEAVLSQTSVADQSKKQNAVADYKMNFLRGADLIGYIDRTGEVYLYNLDDRTRIRLRVRKMEDNEFYSDFIVSRIKVSTDKKFVAIHKLDSFNVWNISISTDLPFKVYTETDMTAAYFNASGNSVCYQKKDSLIILPFDNFTPAARGYRSKIVGFPFLSPDLKKAMFYNNRFELVVYNLDANRVDTVLKDYHYTNPSRRRILNGSSLAAKWVGNGERIVYYDDKLQQVVFSLAHRKAVPALSSYSPDGKYYSWLKPTGLLRVYDRQYSKPIFTDTLQFDSTASFLSDPVNVGGEMLRFSSDGSLLAYQVRKGSNAGFIKVIELETGRSLYQSDQLWSIGQFFTKHMISVNDVVNKEYQGVIFLQNRDRNRSYFRTLYPPLTKADRERLGVNDFFDIF